MKKQTLVWTALPNGSEDAFLPGSTLRLSAYVAPRLWNDDPTVTTMPLSEFPDWLDWPARVGQATIQVEFEGGATLPATVTSAPPRSDLWRALFKGSTPVTPFQFEDLTGATVTGFPAWTLHETIKGIYQRAATDPSYGGGTTLPPNGVLLTDPDLQAIAEPVRPEPPFVPDNPDRGPVNIDEPGPGPEPGPEPDPGPTPDPTPIPLPEGCKKILGGCGCLGCLMIPFVLLRKLLQKVGLLALSLLGSPMATPAEKASAFNQLRDSLAPTTAISQPLPTEPALEDEYDFHQMISLLGDYPVLLRAFGLVVDLTVTLPATLPAPTGRIRLHPTVPMGDPATHYTPWTHYDLGDQQFQARPQPGSDLRNGLLRLDDQSRFHLIQVDVAGSAMKVGNTATTILGVHSLGEWPANAPEESGLPALQSAGLSVVRDESPAQLTGSFRRSYALNGALAALDGSVHPPAADGSAIPPEDSLWADDLVRGYRWDVWDDRSMQWRSLCQRNGSYRFLEPEGGGAPIELTNVLDEGFMQASTTESLAPQATRTLRTHDSLMTWDGWSLSVPYPGQTIQPDHQVSEPQNAAATRFQMESDFGMVSGSLPRLRFGYEYSLRARVCDLAGNSPFIPGTPAFQQSAPERTPPARFRRFEPVSPPPLVPRVVPIEGESLERIVVRSAVTDPAATVGAQASERHIAPPKTSQRMAERLGHFDGTPAMRRDQAGYDLAGREAGSLTHRYDPATQSWQQLPGAQEHTDPTQQRTYWLQTGDSFDITYLPDPAARGVLLLGLPGMASFDQVIEPDGSIVNKIPFDGAWPDHLPIRIRLVGLVAGSAPAPPAWDAANRRLTVELPQGESADVRISSYFDPADIEQMGVWGWVEEAAPPDLATLRATTIQGRNWLHLPYRQLTLVHAVQQPLEIPEISTLAIQPARQVGESQVRLQGDVVLDGKSTSKVDVWADWQDPHDDPAKADFDATTDILVQRMHVGELPVPDGTAQSLPFSALRHAVGDTKYHRVTYTPIATTRFREYFPVGTPADDLIRPLPATEPPVPIELDLPNATRPDAPKPLHVLPIFQWDTTVAGGVTTRQRRGGGLRIYLERPWYSSGAGELLGVVVRPPHNPFDDDQDVEALRKLSSEWGRDALWNAGHVTPLAIGALLDADDVGTNLSLEELPGWAVNVAGYAPVYDSDRHLWSCDVRFDMDERYFPFVRLALARYHPISVPGAHLSRVVLAEYAQLLPHRTVTYDSSALAVTGTLAIRLEGPAYVNSADSQATHSPLVVVRVETRSDGGSDPLGWEVVTAQMLPQVQAQREDCIWEGAVHIPGAVPSPLRVTVFELESFEGREAEQEGVLEWILGGADGVPGGPPSSTAGTRLPPARVTFLDEQIYP